MFQVEIVDSYRLQTYERVMEFVNQFCASHDVVEVKHDVKRDDIIYSIVYRVPNKAELAATVRPEADPANSASTPLQCLNCDRRSRGCTCKITCSEFIPMGD